jgi:hypothetical protein
MSGIPKQSPLSTTQQFIGLRRLGFGHVNLARDRLRFTCELQPTQLSRSYSCVIEYQVGQPPMVRVLQPQLVPDADGALPHFYHTTQSLCLYERGDWYSWMPIANTIVPWAIEWLYFYELWLATGCWFGSGSSRAIPPPKDSPKSPVGQRTRSRATKPCRSVQVETTNGPGIKLNSSK